MKISTSRHVWVLPSAASLLLIALSFLLLAVNDVTDAILLLWLALLF